ncbi:MAG: signal peptide peptidase SppA [Prevotella sp.]|nr:signal peptide peptidase SppA [Prevotella sp.]
MKDFFKYVFATVVGLIVFGIIMAIIGMMSVVGMVASGEATQNVSKNSVLVLNLNAIIDEQAQDNFLGSLTGQQDVSLGLNDILSAIEKAKDNDRIKGIYIEAGGPATSFATLQEIRNALVSFKESGKWIVAYGDSYTQGDYYLASLADKIYMNPQGAVSWHGVGSMPFYIKDAADKFGIHFQIVKVGTFKSATEMFSETKMSDANRQQTMAYLNGLWENVCNAISESRNISVDSLNAYADRLIETEDPTNFVTTGMVDSLIYALDVKAEVKKLLEIDEEKSINQLSVSDMVNVKGKKKKGDEIAVYYAYGDIVDEAAGSSFMSQSHQIVGTDVSADLKKLADDENVKAVVLRVNSPGGSAYASEQIWHSVMAIKDKKPVVVSMGDYAASGGYYISCAADWIVAQPTTLTGSIGIFGVIQEASELVTKKLGVHFDEVKTNKNTTFGNTMARPLNTEELNMLQAHVTRGYHLFRQRVADGRNQPVDSIEVIAQGRVWLGQDALGIKLVDELGGIDVAIAKAAELADLKEFHTTEYPAAPDFFDQLMSASQRGNYLDEQMRQTLGTIYEPVMIMKELGKQNPLQARMPLSIMVN